MLGLYAVIEQQGLPGLEHLGQSFLPGRSGSSRHVKGSTSGYCVFGIFIVSQARRGLNTCIVISGAPFERVSATKGLRDPLRAYGVAPKETIKTWLT